MHRRWTGWGSFVLLAVAVSALPAWCAEGIEGRWEGAIQIGATNLGIVVEFAGQGDELRATIDIPQQGASGLGLTNVRFAPPRVRFDLPAGPGLAEFDGELKEDGSIGGSFEQAGARGTFSMKRAAAAPAAEAAAPPPAIEGRWSGAIEIAGSRLGISVAFARVGSRMSATIDIPEQDAEGLPLNNVRAEGSRVSFELPAGPGLAVFDGTLQERRIGGSFRQGGMAGTFHLEPAAPAPAAPAPPAPPPPYVEEDVQFENGAVKLAGTLTLPKGSGPFPAVVLLTGSGPQNRDEELFGFQPFRVLTDQLTRKGIAVLRYDDRGVGGSSGNTLESTSEDFAGDALAAVALLKARPAIAGQKIGLLGHSEGGIVAPLAAVRSRDVAYIVLLSGTGVTGEAVMLDQAERIARAEGRTPEQIARNTRLQKRIFAAVRSGEGWEELEGAIRAEALDGIESLPAAERGAIADPGEYAGNAAKAQLQFAKSRWFRFFLDYDPATALAKVKVPVLALFGERDLQVATDLNRPAIAGALARAGNKDVTVKVIPGANHLYQAAKTGSVGEYATLPKEFVPGLTDLIADWILQQAAR